MDVVVGLVVGLVAGVASGMAGVGGGVVMVPAMALLLSFDQQLAQGTSALAIVFTAAAASVVNLRNGRLSLRAAAVLGVGGLFGGFVGARFATMLDPDVLQRLFGIFVLVSGLRVGVSALRSAVVSRQST